MQKSTHTILRVQSRTWKKEEKIIYWHYLLIHLVEAKLLSCVKFDVLWFLYFSTVHDADICEYKCMRWISKIYWCVFVQLELRIPSVSDLYLNSNSFGIGAIRIPNYTGIWLSQYDYNCLSLPFVQVVHCIQLVSYCAISNKGAKYIWNYHINSFCVQEH